MARAIAPRNESLKHRPTQQPFPRRGHATRAHVPVSIFVHAACATRDTSPVIGSVTDVYVVTLLPDVIDVIVALCRASEGAARYCGVGGACPSRIALAISRLGLGGRDGSRWRILSWRGRAI